MVLLKANPKGGPKMKPGNYPYDWDSEGRTGYRVGYCDCGAKIVIPIQEAEIIAEVFARETEKFYDKFREMAKPKKSFRQYLIEKLGGQMTGSTEFGTQIHQPSDVYYRK